VHIEEKVSNKLIREECGIWRLREHNTFAYSDGTNAEHYLQSVFKRNIDLCSNSPELQEYIKDWPSEYHLTKKRAQLLSGFDFDPGLKVLEVGCGCGAMTRYLAENFNDVVSIEGSPSRAKLARMRTRDCNNVSIICAPFQDLLFREQFDLIICVGVLEYSALFVDEVEPYGHVLQYFSDLLTPNGRLLIAIENQFGLKYFASSREDHLKQRFEGIEGYPVYGDKVRTFGRVELEQRLSRNFSSIEFFYPYPDYKIPDAVLSEEMLQSGRAAEMVAGFRTRDYYGSIPRLFEESLAILEMGRNNLLSTFANSFLVLAGKQADDPPAFDQLGVMFSSDRKAPYCMRTRFVQEGKDIRVKKDLLHPEIEQDPRLVAHPVSGRWIRGQSLHTRILLRCLARKSSLHQSFELVRPWLDELKNQHDAAKNNGFLPGNYVDCIWKNSFLENERVTFIDQEWEWQQDLSLEVLFIRAMFFFLLETQDIGKLPRYLRKSNTRELIRRVANLFELHLNNTHFSSFYKQEAEFQTRVYGKNPRRQEFLIRWYLRHRRSLWTFMHLQSGLQRVDMMIRSLRRYLKMR
jgi:2-polyprenyl-3-methyl-5-hydroxy-6-metoxy-1,4-benzoquinol methylase